MTTNEIKSNQHKLCDASAHYLFVSKRWACKGNMTQSVIASECAQCCVEATQICANLLKNGEQATKWEEQFILACVHEEFDKAFALLSEKEG